jgi:hypothetical protein
MSTQMPEWSKFKDKVERTVAVNRSLIFRGQANAEWKLITTFFRSGQTDIKYYIEQVIPEVADRVETVTGKKWNTSDPLQLASFLAYLQHHGFPTPLLDWTFSPYIAVYFAMSDSIDLQQGNKEVAIFIFDHQLWQNDYKQNPDYTITEPHVTIMRPLTSGNNKYMIQQGIFTYSNVYDIEGHIKFNEKKNQYLFKETLPISERAFILNDLDLMGINAFSLTPTIEGLCRKCKEQFFPFLKMPRPDQASQNLELFEDKEKPKLVLPPDTK